MLKAREMRKVTASVGLACSRSIWLSIERLTPLALARASRDHPRAARRCFTRAPRRRDMASGGSGGAVLALARADFGLMALCNIMEKVLAYWNLSLYYTGNGSVILEVSWDPRAAPRPPGSPAARAGANLQ